MTTLRGALVQPGDATYDEARTIYNAMIDRRPALIVRCANVADVISAVHYARETISSCPSAAVTITGRG